MKSLAVLALAALAGCPPGARPIAAPPSPGSPRPTPDAPGADAAASPVAVAPRLVVLVIVDQLPAWAFAQKRPALTAGFDRLLREGTWHVGDHPSPATLTAPGHALIGTGEPPARSGILANSWWDREAGAMVHSTDDPAGGVSAARLRVPGLGDAIARAGAGRKAIAVSLKDRAALLPLGHAGTAIWYDRARAAFTATAALPWLDAYNRAHPVAAHLHDVWTPLDRDRIARLAGVPDDAPGEIGEMGFGPTFPHALAATKHPAEAVFAAPLGNDLVFEVAEAALAGERLGADDAADLLVLSLSAHDYVGHGWGQESWEAWDTVLRLDARLGRFLATLDAKVGAGRWAMLVTSDHGGAPMPERTGGGRTSHERLRVAANNAAATELGGGTWIASAKYPYVYLTAAMRAKPARDQALALRKVMFALRAFPGIEQVGKTADFAGHCEQRTGRAAAICRMIDPERAGEVFYLPREHWIVQGDADALGTSHGSLHGYDREVPVLLVPPGRRAHAPLTAPAAEHVAMETIADRVCAWLGVPAPRTLPR